MSLTTTAKVKAWASESMDATRDTELLRCITAASVWIPGVTRRVIEEDTKTLYFDGDEQYGSPSGILEIPKRYSPIQHTDTAVLIWEDGSALTVALGYDTSAGVIIQGADDREQACRLIRQQTKWSNGIQNIKVTFKHGYASDAIPLEIEQLANEVAWVFFKSPIWLGVASESAAGHNKSFQKELTPQSQMLIERMITEDW